MPIRLKFIPNVFVLLYLLVFCGISLAQDCSPNQFPPEKPDSDVRCEMFGKARVKQAIKPNYSSASLEVYLLGKPGDITSDVNSITVVDDVLIMGTGFFAHKNFIPVSVSFSLRSFATKQSKYQNDNRFIVFVDGVEIDLGKAELSSSIGVAESFRLEISYNDFLKLTSGKSISVKFGQTKIDLSSDVVRGMNELQKATRGLKPHISHI